jgi:hypothetical protein
MSHVRRVLRPLGVTKKSLGQPGALTNLGTVVGICCSLAIPARSKTMDKAPGNSSADRALRPKHGANTSTRPHRREKITELNDQFRATFKGGRVQIAPSVYDLDARLCGRALYVVSRYNKFHDDSEHDCGVFIFAGYSFEWQIEYRGKDGNGLSPDPADPAKTFRVLTLYAVNDMLR